MQPSVLQACVVSCRKSKSACRERTDADVAQAARAALEWQVTLPSNRIEVLVENGWVTLSGEVDWPYQSEQAAHAVGSLRGVAGLINRLQIKARVAPANVAEQI
ncbi:BON domain-containing protein, partial [Francisella tularensis]|uniref:BON domain-containing protein n=1 Tax=Francisella tularensis TaxID=263 RepID=UPI001F1634B1